MSSDEQLPRGSLCTDSNNTETVQCSGCKNDCHIRCNALAADGRTPKCLLCKCSVGSGDLCETSSKSSKSTSWSMRCLSTQLKLQQLDEQHQLELKQQQERETRLETQALEREKRALAREAARNDAEKAYLEKKHALLAEQELSEGNRSIRSWISDTSTRTRLNQNNNMQSSITDTSIHVTQTQPPESQFQQLQSKQDNRLHHSANTAPAIEPAKVEGTSILIPKSRDQDQSMPPPSSVFNNNGTTQATTFYPATLQQSTQFHATPIYYTQSGQPAYNATNTFVRPPMYSSALPSYVRSDPTGIPPNSVGSVSFNRNWMPHQQPVSFSTTNSGNASGSFIPQPTMHYPYTFPSSSYIQAPGPAPDRLLPCHTAARQTLSKELPAFSGDPEDWPMFIANFDLSNRLCAFRDGENLIRLQRALKGKALEAVRYLLLLPENVPEVIQTLQNKFGNPETLIYHTLQKIRNEPPPREDKFETIVSYASDVKNMVCTMKASRIDAHLTNPMILQELVERLPSSLSLQWGLTIQMTPIHSIIDFSSWLTNIANAASSVNRLKLLESKSQTKPSKSKGIFLHSADNRSTSENSTSENKETDRTQRSSKSSNACIACGSSSPHTLDRCSTFKSMIRNSRWNLLREHRYCYRCLKHHNGSGKCSSNEQCGIDGCKFKHHTLLHNPNASATSVRISDKPAVRDKPATSTSSSESPSTNVINTHQSDDHTCLYRIVPVILYGPNDSIETFAFLDEGSSLTIIEEETANRLQLSGPEEDLCLRWTGETVRVERASRRISVNISGRQKGSTSYALHNVRTMKNLNLTTQTITKHMISQYPHLKDLPIEPYRDAQPTILIGLDNDQLRTTIKSREAKWNDPIATKTRLGWIVQGHIQRTQGSQIAIHQTLHICRCHLDSDLNEQVKRFSSIEDFGVRKCEVIPESKDDNRARQIMTSTTVRDERGFTTGLLWKFEDFELPNSYAMARSRLICLERKMSKDPILAANMVNQIADYVAKGYARKLLKDEVNNANSSRTWYLPIFPVTNPNKPGKVRIVWDAAAAVQGISLNTMLLKGPDQLTMLTGILSRFREHRIAICGDIKEMYHQVRIQDADQNAQRFLWRDGETNREPDVFVMNVMTFGAACSPSLAHYIKNRNASELSAEHPRAAKAIIENHYVDDLLDSVDTVEEAIDLAKAVRDIHRRGGFEIRNWLSNSPDVLDALGEQSNQTSPKNMELTTETVTSKVLGMFWRTSDDMFTYSLVNNKASNSILNGEQRPTKREVLRTLMSIYDPLGLLSHFLVYIKILLQDVWRSNIAWDDQIADREFTRWLTWVRLLPRIEEIRIPRCLIRQQSLLQSVQLHTFVDASENAFSAVSYFRLQYEGCIECRIVAAKTRVAPQKPLSIPRMELQAAVLGARLAASVSSSHTYRIIEKVFWSDSRNVLCWIRSDLRKYRQFVAFRIGELLETTDIREWRWIPTLENVADDATKWKSTPNLDSSSRWFQGPSFLREQEDQWPIEDVRVVTDGNEELSTVHAHRVCTPVSVIDFNRFSKWIRLVTTQAFVLRFINNLKSKAKSMNLMRGQLTQSEYAQAEYAIIRQVQMEAFPDEVSVLKRNRNISSPKTQIDRSSTLFNRSPYIDDNDVLRLRGRIDAAPNVDLDFKRPVLLPKSHPVSLLIVGHFHQKYHHQNHQTALNEIQKRYSIPSLRVVLNTVRKQCQKCKNDRAAPQIPEMGDLPYTRLTAFTRPFTFVGVDYFGPLMVTVGRRVEKRWCALFTCLCVRAVHLEVAHSLTTDSFILCFRNFIARRGTPVEIASDNGTNFRGADAELREELLKVDFARIERSFVSSNLKWNFNPPAAPHMGGVWERLVRSVKRTFTAIMPTLRTPSDELLRSVLAEAENIVNSRPLTYVALESPGDEAITPNHFLVGSSDGSKPAGQFSDDGRLLRSNWKVSQVLADQFWRRWVSEYLPTLTRRTKWFAPTKPIEKGDIVIIVDPSNPRNAWPKGVVIDTVVGSSQQVRRAVVQTQSGIYTRPVAKLAVLDLSP